MLTLYSTTLSANGRKPLALARQLDIEIELVDIDVYSGEGQRADYLAINPTGKIPTLVDDGLALFESNAILLHLDDRYGGRGLSGTDRTTQSQILRWLFWEASQWQPGLVSVLAPFVGHVLANRSAPDPFANAPAVQWQNESVAALCQILEDELQDGPFLQGRSVSVADFAVAGMMTYFRKAAFPFPDFPAIKRWYDALENLDSWKATEHPLWK